MANAIFDETLQSPQYSTGLTPENRSYTPNFSRVNLRTTEHSSVLTQEMKLLAFK
jgi:hypothetical protein